MDITTRIKLEEKFHYMLTMRPALNKQALFSDTTSDYVSPAEPRPKDKVTFKFRTAKNNVDMVNLVSGDTVVTMSKAETDEVFDYYEATIVLTEKVFTYYFQIKVGKVVCYYNARGVSKDVQDYYNFKVLPGFRTPNWAKGAVMYQIYVDRFYNGDPTNDVLTNEYLYLDDYSQQVTDWEKYPAQMGVREFYGGDLQGVLDKMDYLEDLGVDVIYFNPLFVSPSNHKYDIQDYDYIDPHIGKIVSDNGDLLENGQRENRLATRYIDRVTNKKNLEASNELFAKVVKEAHRRGMKVILDGVFNHCGSFNKWLDRERIYENQEGYEPGAHVSKDSPYRDYFHFYNNDSWPYNTSYDGWWGHDTLPKLNYEGTRDLTNYIMQIGKKWVSPPYNADGWRLDVAADLGHSPEFNHRFWKEFRKSVKLANPNAIIIAEHYGSSRDWLMGDEWDTVMNYDAFMEPITWFLTGMQKHSDDYRDDLRGNSESFWGAMSHHQTNFSNSSLQVSMNELSNHDHSRFLTRTNRKVGRVNTLGSQAANEGINKAVFREAVMMQMTWPGAPTIYYGDEAGLCGFTDPDNRRTYPWGKEDQELIEFHRRMIRVHKLNSSLLTGSLINLGQDYNYLAYGRFTRDDQVIVAVNNNTYEMEKEIEVWKTGIPLNAKLQRIAMTSTDGYSFDTQMIDIKNGKVKVVIPPEGACVFKAIVQEEERTLVRIDEEAKQSQPKNPSKSSKSKEVSKDKKQSVEEKESLKEKKQTAEENEAPKEKDQSSESKESSNEKGTSKKKDTNSADNSDKDEEKAKPVDNSEKKEKEAENKEEPEKTTEEYDVEVDENGDAVEKKSPWELAEEAWGKPEDNKKSWFPFFK